MIKLCENDYKRLRVKHYDRSFYFRKIEYNVHKRTVTKQEMDVSFCNSSL